MQHSKPYIYIFAVSFGLIVEEVMLAAIFSVQLGSGNTVSALAVALIGLSASGIAAYLFPFFQKKERVLNLNINILLIFSILLMMAPVAIMNIPLNHGELSFNSDNQMVHIYRLLIYISSIVPFFVGGLIINIAFRHCSNFISKIYFSDLMGAALGCLASPFLLGLIGAPAAIMSAAVPSAVIAIWYLARDKAAKTLFIVLPLVLLSVQFAYPGLLSFKKINTMGEVTNASYRSFEISWDDLDISKWAVDAWTIVRKDHIPKQWEKFKGWGVSETYNGPIPDIRLVNFNTRFSTYITDHGGDIENIGEWLDSDLISLHYLLGRKYDNVLNIGAGGGREVLNALHHDASSVTAVDVSEAVINDIMKGYLNEFSGNLYSDPRVHAVADEGRSFIERSKKIFDLVDFSVVGGVNLEKMDLVRIDNLFTKEALRTYIRRLDGDGVFSYVMYTQRSDLLNEIMKKKSLLAIPYIPAPRTLTGLRDVFEEMKIGGDFNDHVLVAGLKGIMNRNYDLVHIIFSKKTFTDAERQRFDSTVKRLNFIPYFSSKGADGTEDNLYKLIVTTPDLNGLKEKLPFSIEPSTDDKPFHFAFDLRHFENSLENGVLTDISQIAFKSMAIIPKLRRRRNGFPSAAVR